MADKEVKLKVVTEADIEPLEELDETLDDIQDKTEVNLEVDSDSVDDAKENTDELSEGLDDVDGAEPSIDVDDSGVDDTTEKLDELIDILDEINDKVVAPNVDTSNIEKANEDLKETDSSLSSLQTTLVGLVATAEIEHMATVADNMNNSWNRLELTFQNTNVTMDALRSKVSEVNAETSRGAGAVRNYFNMMGVAGVTNIDLLGDSFESLSGKAYQLDTTVESLEGTMQTMVLTGNASKKMLKNLGLEAVDLANAMGVSVDELSDAFADLSPEQRLQAITTALGNGAQANQMYGDSYEAMKNKADAAMSGLEGAIGQAILPTVIPALDGATQAVKTLTDGFKNLPAPVQNAIGTTMGVAAIATTGIGMFGEFAGAIANLGDAYSVLKGVYEAMIPVEEAEGVAGWLSIGWIAAAILLGIALGLAFIYLYENCDWFREAVDNLASTLQWLGEVIYSSVVSALEWLGSLFQSFSNELDLSSGNWIQSILKFITFIPQLPLKVGAAMLDAIAKTLGFGNNFTSTMTNAATRSVNNFMSWISSLPGKLLNELNRMLSYVSSWAATLPAKFWQAGVNAVKNFLSALGIASPGTMQRMMIWEVSEMARRVPIEGKELVSSIGSLGRSVVDEWDPSLGLDFDGVGNVGLTAGYNSGVLPGGDTIINVYGDVDSDRRVQQIVDAVRRELNWDNKTAGRDVDLVTR